jgi:ribosome-binding protein aMBF1 (putative translation factor)|tara:strand:+ start:138 stop:410 length:273 start_codon:yes stop_codon:yes gene_type:complete
MTTDTVPTAVQYQQAVNELSVRLQVTENQRNDALNSNASLAAKVNMLENVINNMQHAAPTSKGEQVMPDIMETEALNKPKVLGKKANTLG